MQGHRFNIFEDIGCYPAIYNTLLTYFISNIWPILIGLISATYCSQFPLPKCRLVPNTDETSVLSLLAFARRRLQFNQFVNSSASSLTLGRYFRLMALAMADVFLTTPLAIFSICLNASSIHPNPWISWENTHYDYSHVDQFPAIIWRSKPPVAMMMEFTRWVTPVCAFVFFAFFGFADEARKNYGKFFSWLSRLLGIQSWKSRRSIKRTSSTWFVTRYYFSFLSLPHLIGDSIRPRHLFQGLIPHFHHHLVFFPRTPLRTARLAPYLTSNGYPPTRRNPTKNYETRSRKKRLNMTAWKMHRQLCLLPVMINTLKIKLPGKSVLFHYLIDGIHRISNILQVQMYTSINFL